LGNVDVVEADAEEPEADAGVMRDEDTDVVDVVEADEG
jgi:hypothetical protein